MYSTCLLLRRCRRQPTRRQHKFKCRTQETSEHWRDRNTLNTTTEKFRRHSKEMSAVKCPANSKMLLSMFAVRHYVQWTSFHKIRWKMCPKLPSTWYNSTGFHKDPLKIVHIVLFNDKQWTDRWTHTGRNIDLTPLVEVITHMHIQSRDVTKFAFEFDNVWTSNVFSRFKIRGIFSRTRRRIRTSGLHNRHHMSTPTGHRNKTTNWLNACLLIVWKDRK